jgi:hypothetical protein
MHFVDVGRHYGAECRASFDQAARAPNSSNELFNKPFQLFVNIADRFV